MVLPLRAAAGIDLPCSFLRNKRNLQHKECTLFYGVVFPVNKEELLRMENIFAGAKALLLTCTLSAVCILSAARVESVKFEQKGSAPIAEDLLRHNVRLRQGITYTREILDDDMSAEICAKYGITADPRASHKKINLADYGLKAGPVTPTEDMDRFLPNDAVKANAAALEAAGA